MKKLLVALALLLGASSPAFAFDAAPAHQDAALAGSGSGSASVLTFDAAPAPRDAGSAAPAAASATPAPAAPAATDSVAFLDRLVWLWRSGAGMPTAILVLFGVAVAISRRWPWLGSDHRAVYVAAVLAGLGKLADTVIAGQTLNQNAVIGAFAGLWLLIIKAEAPGQAPGQTSGKTPDPEPTKITEPAAPAAPAAPTEPPAAPPAA